MTRFEVVTTVLRLGQALQLPLRLSIVNHGTSVTICFMARLYPKWLKATLGSQRISSKMDELQYSFFSTNKSYKYINVYWTHLDSNLNSKLPAIGQAAVNVRPILLGLIPHCRGRSELWQCNHGLEQTRVPVRDTQRKEEIFVWIIPLSPPSQVVL